MHATAGHASSHHELVRKPHLHLVRPQLPALDHRRLLLHIRHQLLRQRIPTPSDQRLSMAASCHAPTFAATGGAAALPSGSPCARLAGPSSRSRGIQAARQGAQARIGLRQHLVQPPAARLLQHRFVGIHVAAAQRRQPLLARLLAAPTRICLRVCMPLGGPRCACRRVGALGGGALLACGRCRRESGRMRMHAGVGAAPCSRGLAAACCWRCMMVAARGADCCMFLLVLRMGSRCPNLLPEPALQCCQTPAPCCNECLKLLRGLWCRVGGLACCLGVRLCCCWLRGFPRHGRIIELQPSRQRCRCCFATMWIQ